MSRTETHLVNQNDQKLKGVIFAVVGAIFWGASGIFTQMLFTDAGVQPLWLVGIRLFLPDYCWLSGARSKTYGNWALFGKIGMMPCC